MCNKCGVKHVTGKNCPAAQGPQQTGVVNVAARQVDIPGPPQPRVPSNGSPVGVPVGKPSFSHTIEQSMDLLANTVSSMPHSMKAMQKELVELQADRASSSWNHVPRYVGRKYFKC